MGRSLILIIALLIVSGCNESKPPKPKFEKFISNVVIEEDKNLETLGRQQTVGGVCFIKLKQYPLCLQHEVRHCIEGNWHEGYKSDADCFENE